MRKQINLNFDWKYVPNFMPEYLNKIVVENSEEVMIPHTMKELPLNYFNEKDYQYIGTYSKLLSIEESMLNNNLILDFQGVMSTCKVYINGELLLIHDGGYTPFKVNISDKVQLGDNILQVIVDSTEIKDIPPFGHLIDYLAFSGIYRPVTLYILPKTYIKTVHIATHESEKLQKDRMLMEIDVVVEQENTTEYKLKAELFYDSKLIYEEVFKEKISKLGNYTIAAEGIKRWDIDEPNLYELVIKVMEADKIIDSKSSKFGFRTVRFTSEGFLINNQFVKLIGLNRHQSYPYVGYAMPKSMQELDADILKDWGCNIVRTSHYMQSEDFLNRCDEIGLLVLEEIPGWQYIGNDQFKELTYQNIRDMIENHYNHPSIITWGVRINESLDDYEFYKKTNELARELDPIRQTCGIRNTKKGDFLEDIYTYNDFSHVGNNKGLENPNKVTPGYVPYLVTEHNGHVYPTKITDHPTRQLEQALRHTNVIEAVYDNKRISGAIGWCLADYNTHIQFGSNDRVCYHGVMDMFRMPKLAAYAYKIQNPDKPVLYVASDMMAGDYKEFKLPEIVIFTNCDYIKLYKNEVFIGDFYPDFENYPNLPYPPLFVNDLIGESLIENENYDKKTAKRISNILKDYNLNGMNLSFINKLNFARLTMSKKFSNDDVFYLFEKYIAHQYSAPIEFKFEGYVDDEKVIEIKKGHTTSTQLTTNISHSTLLHNATYDVSRIVVDMVDQNNNRLPYTNENIEIETSKHLKLIGPSNLNIKAGSASFYVKTTGKTGKAEVKIKPNNHPVITLKINVKKG